MKGTAVATPVSKKDAPPVHGMGPQLRTAIKAFRGAEVVLNKIQDHVADLNRFIQLLQTVRSEENVLKAIESLKTLFKDDKLASKIATSIDGILDSIDKELHNQLALFDQTDGNFEAVVHTFKQALGELHHLKIELVTILEHGELHKHLEQMESLIISSKGDSSSALQIVFAQVRDLVNKLEDEDLVMLVNLVKALEWKEVQYYRHESEVFEQVVSGLKLMRTQVDDSISLFDSRIKSLEHSLERLRAMRPYDEVIQLLEFRRDNFSRLREFFSTKIKGVKFLEKSAEHYLKSYMTNSDFDLRKVIPIEAFASTQIGFAIDLLEKTILHSLKTAPNKALFQFETEYIDLVFRVIIDNFLSIILRCKEIRGLGEKKKRKLSTRKELKVFGKLNSLVRELRKLRALGDLRYEMLRERMRMMPRVYNKGLLE